MRRCISRLQAMRRCKRQQRRRATSSATRSPGAGDNTARNVNDARRPANPAARSPVGDVETPRPPTSASTRAPLWRSHKNARFDSGSAQRALPRRARTAGNASVAAAMFATTAAPRGKQCGDASVNSVTAQQGLQRKARGARWLEKKCTERPWRRAALCSAKPGAHIGSGWKARHATR